MSACAAATDLARVPLENSTFYSPHFSTPGTTSDDGNSRARQIKRVLRQAGLTMSRISALTGIRYGKKTPYFVPPTFFYKQKNGVTPHICQIMALSQITGYRFRDWMSLSGFDLELIFPLQLKVHTKRTAIVTPTPNFRMRDFVFVPACSEPLKPDRRYLFAKIGSCDNVVFPKVLPGSLVRVDRCYSPRQMDLGEELLWLVEHPSGLACCHVKRFDNENIILLPSRPPLSAWPLQIPREARILGLVDLELRPREIQQFPPSYCPMKSETLATIPHCSDRMTISRLLRGSRLRTGLTLRAAHEMTLRIAQLLRSRQYAIPLGLLSDYEATDQFPRHIAKIMSLCIVYGIDFWELMEAGGSYVDDSAKAPLLPLAA
jgi:hypothetical protein